MPLANLVNWLHQLMQQTLVILPRIGLVYRCRSGNLFIYFSSCSLGRISIQGLCFTTSSYPVIHGVRNLQMSHYHKITYLVLVHLGYFWSLDSI